MSSPACRVSTPPPVPPASDILAAGTPVGKLFFTLSFGLKQKKWDCSPASTPEGQNGKGACTGTDEGGISSGHSTLPIQLVASHSPKQPWPELVNLPSSPVKVATNPNDRLATEALGSTTDSDRDSVVEVSRDDADQSGNKSHSSSDLLKSAADSNPESTTRDCLTCSDTKEAVINSANKKFQKEV